MEKEEKLIRKCLCTYTYRHTRMEQQENTRIGPFAASLLCSLPKATHEKSLRHIRVFSCSCFFRCLICNFKIVYKHVCKPPTPTDIRCLRLIEFTITISNILTREGIVSTPTLSYLNKGRRRMVKTILNPS